MALARAELGVTAFLDRLQAVLGADVARGFPPRVRRNLGSITEECGRKGSVVFLEELDRCLESAGIYSEPPLGGSRSPLGPLVHFSMEPFPPDPMYFPAEEHRQRYPNGKVKGIIVSGLEDQFDGRLLGAVTEYEIECLCYQVAFTRKSKSA